MVESNITAKANRVLNIILLCLLLILIRVWYLSVIQHDQQLEQAHKPQRRVVIEPVERATIRDRFNIPLAVNKIQYNAAVCYANIRQIPSVAWRKNEEGKTVRVQARMEHIVSLSRLLAEELSMDAQVIEDTIHGKASLFPHTPFVVKEEITEQQYYRLRMLEKEWLGMHPQRAYRRYYPHGKVACDVLGYLGSISQNKYFTIAQEMRELEEYLSARERNENPFLPKGFDNPLEVRARLHELQEKAYNINDLVGKAGLEAQYEEELRGYHGKKTYEVDVKGNFLRELPGSRKAVSGRRLISTISAELQEYAESLLAAYEGPRETEFSLDERWMKGGAVVAMIPKTGEVVALASYPRFDPNDFIPTRDPEVKKGKEAAIQKWLESEAYIRDIWDGKLAIDREYFSFVRGRYIQESFRLTWEKYLEAILPSSGPVHNAMAQISDLQTALAVQDIGTLHPLLHPISLPEDKLLILDLCRLAAKKEAFNLDLLQAVGKQSLASYHLLRQATMRVQSIVRRYMQELYHDVDFVAWRKSSFKEYLKKKRKEEREEKKYTRPYTDYLDDVEKQLFQAFWNAYRWIFLYAAITDKCPVSPEQYPHLHPYFVELRELHRIFFQDDSALTYLRSSLGNLNPSLGLAYLQTMRSFEELDRPLLGEYRRVRQADGQQLEKHLAAAFYPQSGYGFARSQAYRQGYAQGSVFKVVTAYQALVERQKKGAFDLNPLTLIDDLKGDKSTSSKTQVLGYMLDGHPIFRSYKGGFLPRSSHSHMGRVDLLGALEQSSNVYFAILAGDHIQDPMNLANAARLFGFGEKTGIDLPGEFRGNVPDDLDQNRTGLYSFAIGQHTLIVSPLQSALMFSAIANKGDLVKPKIIQILAGKEPVREDELLFSADNFRFQDDLALVGIHFPLFTATQINLQQGYLFYPPSETIRTIPFQHDVYAMLSEGMRRVVIGPRGTARPSIIKTVYDHPSAVRDYRDLHYGLLAKTGTAQIRYKQTLDVESLAEMKKNIWFNAISYPSSKMEDPELVVVVFLRFADAGRDGAPIAAQVIKKWRELCAKHSSH